MLCQRGSGQGGVGPGEKSIPLGLQVMSQWPP
jgi:hypothetical protein